MAEVAHVNMEEDANSKETSLGMRDSSKKIVCKTGLIDYKFAFVHETVL